MDSEPTPIAEGLGMSSRIRGAMTKVMTIEEARGVAPVSTRTLDKARACAKPVMGPAKFSTRFNLGKEDPSQAVGLRMIHAARGKRCLPSLIANPDGSRLLLWQDSLRPVGGVTG